MMMDIYQTYCGDPFGIYLNIESLCCTPDTNVRLYVNYIFKKVSTFDIVELLWAIYTCSSPVLCWRILIFEIVGCILCVILDEINNEFLFNFFLNNIYFQPISISSLETCSIQLNSKAKWLLVIQIQQICIDYLLYTNYKYNYEIILSQVQLTEQARGKIDKYTSM